LYKLLKELFPICRSITGDGLKKTLDIISKYVPIRINKIQTGKKIFDWKVPEEWNIESAYIKNKSGKKIVDFSKNNLHVVSYSEPTQGWFSLAELKKHLHTLPNRPNAIPYITSYYKRDWGFCISYNQYKTLSDEKYYVEINSQFKKGNLLIAEARLPGKIKKDILLSSYICHPSMANDSLSGVVLLSKLYEKLKSENRYYGYRFIFIPETIGSIAYLHKNKTDVKSWMHAGLICTCVGDSGKFNYKKSRLGNSPIDKVAENILKYSNHKYLIRDFWPEGSDERQFCSPGFNLPVGSLMRSVYGEFPEYHTSEDNLQFVKKEYLDESFELYFSLLQGLQLNGIFNNTISYCEPHLSKYDLYPSSASHLTRTEDLRNMLWILNYSDGNTPLVEIANKIKRSILDLKVPIKELESKGLLERVG